MRFSLLAPGSFMLLGILVGCASSGPEAALPEPRLLGRDLSIVSDEVFQSEVIQPPALPDTLTLRDAFAFSLRYNPDMAAYAWEVRARDAAALQAGRYFNPILNVERENFAGNLRSDDTQVQTTVEISLPIELAGQRSARRRAALLARNLAGWDYESLRLDVFAETLRRFAEVAGAQERLALTAATVNTAGQILETVVARVEAGKVSPVEAARAGVVVSSAEIAHTRAARGVEAARARLAALWGLSESKEGVLTFHVSDATAAVAAPPDLATLTTAASLNPDLARWDSEVAQRAAELSLERRSRIPTPTLGGGYRQFEGTGHHAFVATAGLVLPLFNQNRGAVRAAQYRLNRAEAERLATEVRLNAELAAAHSRLDAAYAELTTLHQEVLPAAERTFHDIEEGYRLGKFAFLDVLDAQRTLADIRFQYARARVDYYHAVADVERLAATPVTSQF